MAIPPAQAAVAAELERLAGCPPVETHISAVFRGPETVWKLKKAVRLPFLDFTDPDQRRHFLQREAELNARWAPGLYQDVIRVEAGGTVDWALRMARVPEADFLDRMAADGRLGPALLDGLADAVAEMHAALPPVPVAQPEARLQRVAAGNADSALAAGLPANLVQRWRRDVLAAIAGRQATLEARAAAGLVRRAHGDLHLGNLLMWQGRPAPFDALEFDEDLATIDLGYDLAFLLMDLDCLVSRAAANRVLGRYTGRTGDAGLVAALPPFLSLRAMIRAHVCASRGQESGYARAALSYLAPAGRPVVLAVGGLMGTGKTTLARAIAPGLGPAPGALLVRSDEVRKRLQGRVPEDRLPPEAYGPEPNRRTDDALLAAVSAAAASHAVIADATFLDPALRGRVAQAARQAGAAFLGVWLQVPLAELERRVAARSGDASDATVEVLRAAAPRAPPPSDWLHVDATSAESALAMVQEALSRL